MKISVKSNFLNLFTIITSFILYVKGSDKIIKDKKIYVKIAKEKRVLINKGSLFS